MNCRYFLPLVVLSAPVFGFGGGHTYAPLPPPPPPPPPILPSAPPPPPAALPSGSSSSIPGNAGPSSSPTSGGTGAGANSTTPTGGGGSAATPTGTGSTVNGPIAPKFPTGVATGAMVDSVDYTTWEYWWNYNQAPYLDVKRHIEASAIRSGPDASIESARAWDRIGERLVPVILATLDTTTDSDSKLSAMIAAARLCDGDVRRAAPDVAKRLVALRTDPSRVVAEGSVLALGILGQDASVSDLCALLGDTESARRALGGRAVPERMRAFAAYALGLLGTRTQNEEVRRFAVHHLTERIRDTEQAMPDTNAACSIALGLIRGDSTVLELTEKATGVTKQMLGRGDVPSDETTLLLALLEDTKAPLYVRAHVPQSLARLAAGTPASQRVAQALLGRLESPAEKAEVVQGCVLALGALGTAGDSPLDARIRRALLSQTDQGDVQARCFALVALAQNAGRGPAGEGLEKTRERLAKGLSGGRQRERTWSALAYGVLEHARSTPEGSTDAMAKTLTRLLQEARSPEEIGAYATACGLAGVREAVPNLLARLDTVKEGRALSHVQAALGLLGADEARGRLSTMLVEARTCAEKLPRTALALTLLEDPTLTDQLVALLDVSTSQSTMLAVAEALGTSGDRRAIEPLLAVTKDERFTAHSRSAAVSALGRICDRDALPWQNSVSTGLNYRAMTATLSAADQGGLLDLH